MKLFLVIINTVEERRNAIGDSRQIRIVSVAGKGHHLHDHSREAVEGMKYLNDLSVYSVQELHAQLSCSSFTHIFTRVSPVNRAPEQVSSLCLHNLKLFTAEASAVCI
jgi:hypothetical protein